MASLRGHSGCHRRLLHGRSLTRPPFVRGQIPPGKLLLQAAQLMLQAGVVFRLSAGGRLTSLTPPAAAPGERDSLPRPGPARP